MRIISSDIKNTKNARYLDVHMLYTRVKPPPMMNPSEEHLVATISLLNVKGDPLDGYNRCLVEFNYVLSYIGKHQGTKKIDFFFVILQMKVLVKNSTHVICCCFNNKCIIHNRNFYLNLVRILAKYCSIIKPSVIIPTTIHYGTQTILSPNQINVQN